MQSRTYCFSCLIHTPAGDLSLSPTDFQSFVKGLLPLLTAFLNNFSLHQLSSLSLAFVFLFFVSTARIPITRFNHCPCLPAVHPLRPSYSLIFQNPGHDLAPPLLPKLLTSPRSLSAEYSFLKQASNPLYTSPDSPSSFSLTYFCTSPLGIP